MPSSSMPPNMGPISIASDDPEVMTLQALLKGIEHFGKRDLTMRHIKVMLAVELCYKVTSGKLCAGIDQIAMFSQLRPEEFESELRDLLERRYLVEDCELTGPIFYKIGPMGGTVLRNMMNRKVKRKTR